MANRNHTFKHTPKLYKKPTQLAQASANSESLAKTPTQSANGVKNSGKHSQTQLQREVGEQMAKLVFDQMRLAEKCRIINRSLEALIK